LRNLDVVGLVLVLRILSPVAGSPLSMNSTSSPVLCATCWHCSVSSEKKSGCLREYPFEQAAKDRGRGGFFVMAVVPGKD
jgi:hypothetical protein